MKRGPKPKYTPEERDAQGNPGRRPDDVKTPDQTPVEYDDFFPAPPVTAPPPPAFLTEGTTEEGDTIADKAVGIWEYLAAYVFEAKLFRNGDTAALGRLCRYLAEWDSLTKIIDDEGFTIQGGQGLQRHPALIARNALEAQIQKLESQFGLNPEDRLALTKDFSDSLKNLPLANRTPGADKPEQQRGPVGFLKKKEK